MLMLGNDPFDELAGVVDLLVELVVPLEDLPGFVGVLVCHELKSLVLGILQCCLERILVHRSIRVLRACSVQGLVSL